MHMPPGKFFTMFHFLEYPFSRGETHILSPSAYDAPDFDAGFVSTSRYMEHISVIDHTPDERQA